MTDHTNLIARLRLTMQQVNREAADALEELQAALTEETLRGLMLEKSHEELRAEVERLKKMTLNTRITDKAFELVEKEKAALEVRVGAMMVERSDSFFRVIKENDQLQARLTALESQEPVAYGVLASNTGKLCQFLNASNEDDMEELAEMNQKYIVPLFAAGAAPVAPWRCPHCISRNIEPCVHSSKWRTEVANSKARTDAYTSMREATPTKEQT